MELRKEWISVPLSSLVASPNNMRRHSTQHVDKHAVNMAQWWQAFADGYLKHLSKAQMVLAIEDPWIDARAVAVSGLKKGALADKATTLLKGAGWLPSMLRAPTPAA